MSRPFVFCLVSALLGGLAATAWHQAAPFRTAAAQQPLAREPVFSPPLPGRPAESPPRTAPVAALPTDWGTVGLEEFTPEERTNIQVYERANRSVVHITTKTGQRELLFLEVPAEGTGSGSILDQRGHILTNYHVVEGASEIRVTLASGDSFEAALVGQIDVMPPGEKILDVPDALAVSNEDQFSRLGLTGHARLRFSGPQ